jgi:imidazoleglycerol-phosphate dehydratase
MARTATLERKTAETSISLTIDLDGSGKSEVSTGIGFFDHMLALFAKHGLFDLRVVAEGDLHVDYHHTVEDTAIVLGEAIKLALGDKAGIRRYGLCYAPMDEALVRCVVDLGGRPYLAYNASGDPGTIGVGFGFQLIEEFLRGFVMNAAMNLHVDVLAGRDAHHMAEAIFKSLARAVDDASSIDPRVVGVPSTKGVL